MAVFTATVVTPAPPFALVTVRTRARPDEVHVLPREVAKRVKDSIRASEPACISRYSRAPARMAETIVDGSFIGPIAKIAMSLVVEWISSMALIARCTLCESISTSTTSARTSCIWRTMGSVALAGKPTWVKTFRPMFVVSSRCWSTDTRSFSSVNNVTAIPCMAWASLVSPISAWYEWTKAAPSDLGNHARLPQKIPSSQILNASGIKNNYSSGKARSERASLRNRYSMRNQGAWKGPKQPKIRDQQADCGGSRYPKYSVG